MYSMPQGPTPFGQRMTLPPYQVQQRMQGPRRPFPQQIARFPQPMRPNIPPPVQQPDIQQQVPPQIVLFNKKQDLVNLLANFESFKAKSQEEQHRQIQQMLYYIILARLNTNTEANWNLQEKFYHIQHISQLMKLLIYDETIEQLKEASCW